MAKSQTLNLSVIGSNPIQSTKKTKENIMKISKKYIQMSEVYIIFTQSLEANWTLAENL